ncbi:MAG: hypothetical protein IKL27_00405, partial [Oscillospiraceae bacterium]|nr:hypothetical protein [Oscillospiraceae bacterium]
TMPDMGVKYDEKVQLNPNAFGCPGYYFDKWNTKADGSGQSYEDQAYVRNLSDTPGVPVTLYAQWTPCSHDPDEHTYTYTAEGNVLTGKCSCAGYTVTATLQASDVTYDQLEHKANLVITTNAAVGAVPASSVVEAKLRNITEVYNSYTADAWTPMEDGKFPINAGQYRAGVTVSGQTAVKEYTIQKASQPAPSKPAYKTHNDDSSIENNKLKVEEVQQSELAATDITDTGTGKIGYDCRVEYAVIYDQGDGTLSEPVWQESVEFTLNTALTNYYVLARYSQGTNYEASDYSRADSKYFFAGNVTIVVHGVDGVDYKLKEATINDDVVTGVELILTIKNGYYFPNGDIIKEIRVKPAVYGPLTPQLKPGGSKTQIAYSITNIRNNSSIDIYLSPVTKLPTVKSYVTGGQVFADFTDTEALISRDSAYTARFVVNNFDKDVYTGAFEIDGLPNTTPLILMKKVSGATTYYRAEASDTGVIPLDSFIGMGTKSTGFLLNEAEQHITLQLIAIPFEDISGTEVSTAFILTHTAEQPNAADVSGIVTVELADKAEFEVSEDEGRITLSYTPSAGTASIWDGRDNALVLKAADDEKPLPEDAKLNYSYGTFTRECSINAEGSFVIPLEELRSGDITLSFTLSTKMETGTYTMNAEWYVACSQAETAPMNGSLRGTGSITLSAEKANVSVQISAQGHLYNARDILSADIKVNGVEGYTTKLDIQKKVDGKYVSIDVARTVIGNCTETFNLSDDPGSYRLYLYAYTSYDRVETAYYFIVK